MEAEPDVAALAGLWDNRRDAWVSVLSPDREFRSQHNGRIRHEYAQRMRRFSVFSRIPVLT
ncbi:hypothetical protein Misp03_23160 [Microbispora sp. NBRC 16548]|nr:hypothetical protein Misp03_23160 [Microbispora sp. NBRC 16548]